MFHIAPFCPRVACMLCQFTCEKVGQMAKAKGKPQWISTVYDEVGQMVSGHPGCSAHLCLLFRLCGQWSERAFGNDSALDIPTEALQVFALTIYLLFAFWPRACF